MTQILTDTQLEQMEKYNLDDVRDADTLELLGFICLNCGMRYLTIELRMEQPVDGCQGCFHKTKWG